MTIEEIIQDHVWDANPDGPHTPVVMEEWAIACAQEYAKIEACKFLNRYIRESKTHGEGYAVEKTAEELYQLYTEISTIK